MERASVPRMETTRGSPIRLLCSWSRARHRRRTRAPRPRDSRTWVKPPVDAPISRHMRPAGSIAEIRQRRRELHPAPGHPGMGRWAPISALAADASDALRTVAPSTRDQPSRDASCALRPALEKSRVPPEPCRPRSLMLLLMACAGTIMRAKAHVPSGAARYPGITAGFIGSQGIHREISCAVLACRQLCLHLVGAPRNAQTAGEAATADIIGNKGTSMGQSHCGAAGRRRSARHPQGRLRSRRGGTACISMQVGDCSDVADVPERQGPCEPRRQEARACSTPKAPTMATCPTSSPRPTVRPARRSTRPRCQLTGRQRPARRRWLGARDPRRRGRPHRPAYRQFRRPRGLRRHQVDRIAQAIRICRPATFPLSASVGLCRLVPQRLPSTLATMPSCIETGVRVHAARACPGRCRRRAAPSARTRRPSVEQPGLGQVLQHVASRSRRRSLPRR